MDEFLREDETNIVEEKLPREVKNDIKHVLGIFADKNVTTNPEMQALCAQFL